MAKLHGREIALVFCLAVVTEISGEPTLYLTALGTLSTALPLAAFFLLVPLKGASFSSASTFFIPFVAVALGALLLGDKLSMQSIAGFAFALAGSYHISSPAALTAPNAGSNHSTGT